MKRVLTVLLINFVAWQTLQAQVKTFTEDKEWQRQSAEMKKTLEAEFLIRIGDIDNLGFGWPEGFDPFCSRSTDAHSYPWDARSEDLPGFDRILLSSSYKTNASKPCGEDGYSGSYHPVHSKPVPYSIPTTLLKGATIQNAFLQIFLDDFQSPSFCSKFQVTLNGRRFAEAEKLLSFLDQTGPIGKLVTIPIPEEFFSDLIEKNALVFFIDDVKGSGDGFAIDFIRLLVNRHRTNTCKGNIRGRVIEKETERPIAGAKVFLVDQSRVETDAEGIFLFKSVPTGYEIVGATFPGYIDGATGADIGEGDDNPEVTIYLEKGKTVTFNNKSIRVGETVRLNNILFDQGKADIKEEARPELNRILELLQSQPTMDIELSGHTSSEGDAALNRSLSYKRVNACKRYLLDKGIDPGRIIAVGYGPDRPVAPNDTEANRTLNRRVEMRVMKQ